MTAADFDALFDSFTTSVVRLETLPAYLVGGAEAERLRAFREGRPRPERSLRTDPWLRRIALTTVAGKSWTRVRVVDTPLTEYQRYQLASHLEAQVVGERVLMASREDVSDRGEDFWLFDRGLPTARAAVMHYDRDGRWLGVDLVTDPAVLAELGKRVDTVCTVAAPLNEFLA